MAVGKCCERNNESLKLPGKAESLLSIVKSCPFITITDYSLFNPGVCLQHFISSVITTEQEDTYFLLKIELSLF